jgi:hypothetical protein
MFTIVATNPQMSDSNKNLVLGPIGMLDTKTDWLTVGRNITFDFDFLQELDNCWGSVVVSCCCEKLVAETRDSSGTQRKQNICHWKLPPKSG